MLELWHKHHGATVHTPKPCSARVCECEYYLYGEREREREQEQEHEHASSREATQCGVPEGLSVFPHASPSTYSGLSQLFDDD